MWIGSYVKVIVYCWRNFNFFLVILDGLFIKENIYKFKILVNIVLFSFLIEEKFFVWYWIWYFKWKKNLVNWVD